MTTTPDLEKLHHANHKALLDLLSVDLDLGFTFAELAKSGAQAAHAQVLKARAEQVLQVVEHFEQRIEDATAKSRVKRRVAELKRFVSTIGSETEPRPRER